MTNRYDRILHAVREKFNPIKIEIVDESARHAGHAQQIGGPNGETHYRIMMVANVFTGQTRLERSRAVHETLAAEFKTGLHALSLVLRTPEEDVVSDIHH